MTSYNLIVQFRACVLILPLPVNQVAVNLHLYSWLSLTSVSTSVSHTGACVNHEQNVMWSFHVQYLRQTLCWTDMVQRVLHATYSIRTYFYTFLQSTDLHQPVLIICVCLLFTLAILALQAVSSGTHSHSSLYSHLKAAWIILRAPLMFEDSKRFHGSLAWDQRVIFVNQRITMILNMVQILQALFG